MREFPLKLPQSGVQARNVSAFPMLESAYMSNPILPAGTTEKTSDPFRLSPGAKRTFTFLGSGNNVWQPGVFGWTEVAEA